MRIVGGKFKGHDLTSPSDFRVRPTAEHVRAAMLDVLGAEVKDARVLELFAGTGALGLEAISRGAKSCDFLETRPASLHALRSNIIRLRVKESTRIFKRDALQFAAILTEGSYDLTFADPPYGSKQLDRLLDQWMATKFSPVLAIEHERGHKLPAPSFSRTMEDTVIAIYRA